MKHKPKSGKKSRGTAATVARKGQTLIAAKRISQSDVAVVPASYPALFAEIKERVRGAQVRAHLAASREMILACWQIGRAIVSRQKEEGWGKAVIERLAGDLQREFPGIEGFSANNIWRMRAFYLAYAGDAQKLAQPAQELDTKQPDSDSNPNLAQAAQVLPPPETLAIPWFHNVILIQKVKDRSTRLWYAAKAVENGWSRDVLALQIDSALHERQGKAVTNFAATLPPPQSDLAQQITKDPYLFDFLNLRDDANERAVELGLLEHVEKFLLELGAGFALVGRQVHLEIGGQDFYLDLLFYHLHLRCFLVVDLKARDFTPEAAGKMNFYLSAVDDRFRHAGDQPSIGLILCRQKNRVIAEYALRDIQKPVGVSGYVTRLVETLPAPMKNAVPSVEDLERELKDVAEPPAPKARKRPTNP